MSFHILALGNSSINLSEAIHSKLMEVRYSAGEHWVGMIYVHGYFHYLYCGRALIEGVQLVDASFICLKKFHICYVSPFTSGIHSILDVLIFSCQLLYKLTLKVEFPWD